jgi:tetratricopeptide (TPR) repeat protein
MKPELWAEVKTLFLDLVDTAPEHRSRVLEATPEPVRSQVRRLLANSDAAESAANPIDEPLVKIGNLDSLFAGIRAFEPGQVLLDRFEIRSFLGAGGMGEVFEAYDRALGEVVALKSIRPELADDPGILQRFRWEVQRARSVSHPNVCRVYELFTLPGSPEMVFLTMERIAGPTLAGYLAEEAVGFAEMNRVAEQVCAGLHAAHAAGLIHRDLKTGNILIDRTGKVGTRAVITDFGLARRTAAAAGAEPGTDLSLSGPVGGTPVYQAPELVKGAAATTRSDLYALGVVLYRMAAGRYPDGKTGLRALNPEVPEHWAAAVARCLEEDPMRRPESAATLAAMLKPGSFSRRALLLAAAGLGMAGAAAWVMRPEGRMEPGQPLAIGTMQGTAGKLMENLLRLTLAGSRRVRLQSGAAAVLSGEVSRSGEGLGFVLTLRRPDAREAKAAGQVTGARELPGAVRRAALALDLLDERDPAAAANIPLEEMDTADLEAMEALTGALALSADGKLQMALTMLQSATERDPEFALAYVYTALLHTTMRREALGLAPARRALELKHRLSRRVRPHAEAVYAVVRGDLTAALANYEDVAQRYPHEVPLQRHVAQMYTILLRRQEALQVVRRAVALDATSPLNQMMLVSALADLGEHEEAARAAAELRKQQPESVMGVDCEGVRGSVGRASGRGDRGV